VSLLHKESRHGGGRGGGVDESVQDRNRETGKCMEDRKYLLDDKGYECLLNDHNEALMKQSKRNSIENATAVKNERGCKFCRISLRSRRSRKVRILIV